MNNGTLSTTNAVGGRAEDGSRVYQFGLAGLSAPPPDSLAFSDARAYMRGVTVVNQSTLAIGLYFNRTAFMSQPDVVIYPNTAQAMPLPSIKQLGIGFAISPNAPPTGSAYLHYTTDLVSNTSGPAASYSTANFIWDESLWNQTNW